MLTRESTLQIEGAHPVGAMAVTWSPAAPPGLLVSAKGPGRPERRFASAGCDNTVKVRPHRVLACLDGPTGLRHQSASLQQSGGDSRSGLSSWACIIIVAPGVCLQAWPEVDFWSF